MPQKNIDVLIVGAGPTGLTLACELLRHGLKIRLIDKLPAATTQSRALALQARSLDIFEKLGVLGHMLDKGLPVDTVHLYENGKQIGQTSFTDLPIAYPFVLIIPQADTEAILTKRLQELGGTIERNTPFINLQDNLEARWIVGCDGAHSTVRHALGLPFKGTRFSENFGLADVSLPNFPFSHREIHAFINAKGILGIIPLPTPHHFRLIMTFPNQETPELTKALLESTLQFPIEKIIWASLFSIHRRIVSHFSKGPVFLCGDAAHIHSPAGGQGLNIGIQDAFNLAWKLALVHTGSASPKLLDTYHEERHPVARHTLWATTLATFFISTPYPWLRDLLFRTLGKLFRWRFFRRRFSAALAETKTHYRSSSLSRHSLRNLFWPGPRPGDLAPFLENDSETRFILLVFGNPDYLPTFPHPLAIRHLPLDHVLALPYRASKPCLYLIRPDGYIALRSRRFSHKLQS